MLAIFSKNCVLMGDLDSYCLVCSILLTGDELEHIKSPEHNAKLKPTVYFEKYKDDFIKRVNGVYFCEACNKTFSTAAKVGIHVTEETHIKRRRRQLTRVGTSVVFQKDTLIEESAWNGLVEDSCLVCNADFDDHSTHMYEHSHALNVVRRTVTIDDDNDIYREVEEGFQCLTCNKVISNTGISKHLDSEQHKATRISLGCTKNDADNNNIAQRNEKKKEQTKENEVSGDDTKVTSNKNVDTKVLTENPSVTEGKAINKLTPVCVSKELETFANKHGLFVTEDTFSLNCQICSTVVPGVMHNVKEHISGKNHTDNIKRQPQADKALKTLKLHKVLAKDYLGQTVIVDCKLGRYVIINDSFCVKFNHFFCLLDVGTIICQLCDTVVTGESRATHLTSLSHDFKLRNAMVITTLKDEFVRQIKSRYHCGFCGVYKKTVRRMFNHLSTPVHKQNKVTHKMILQRIKDEEISSIVEPWY